MNWWKVANRKGDKIYYHFDFGRGKGQRPSAGVFTYAKPKSQAERNHNKEALAILELKKSQTTLERQAIGSGYIPKHKFKENFLDYFAEYVSKHHKNDNRHLPCCFVKFKKFVKKDFIAPVEITPSFCKEFRKYLLDNLTGETPQNYFARFKWCLTSAKEDGYFLNNPAEKVAAKRNPSIKLKKIIEVEEYYSLLNTPWPNVEVPKAFIFCCYTALRWCDVKPLQWKDIKDGQLTTRIIQEKTGHPVIITLHEVALSILNSHKKLRGEHFNEMDTVFDLPTADGANGVLKEWGRAAGIEHSFTWSCARLSFSVLLKDKNIDDATIAYLMGHTTTKQVQSTYKRHRPKDQTETIKALPTPENMPYYLLK